MDPQEKAGLYGQQLSRCRHYLEKACNEGKAVSLPLATPAAAAPGEAKNPQPPTETRDLDARVIESVGKNMKKKAGLLLDHLKKSKVLNLNAQGQVSYRGRSIPNYNIIDLVSDTMRMKSRKNHPQPAGILEFAEALKKTNTPQNYVQNPEVIKPCINPEIISTPKALDDEDDEDGTGFQDASSLSPLGSPFYDTPFQTSN